MNRTVAGGVWLGENGPMGTLAERLTGFTDVERDELAREFEARLVESSTLAFRVAYGVLRHREDAEDVAQEAFAKAYRSFRQLRDRARFRAWLVRMRWRLALDRQRAERRRLARDTEHARASVTSTAGPAVERLQSKWVTLTLLLMLVSGPAGWAQEQPAAEGPESVPLKVEVIISRYRVTNWSAACPTSLR